MQVPVAQVSMPSKVTCQQLESAEFGLRGHDHGCILIPIAFIA
jgi:hypothetical protein